MFFLILPPLLGFVLIILGAIWQILNLLNDLQDQFGLTYLFISHDLGVVQHICNRVAVMYLGKVVEIAPTHTLFHQPRHPYTEALLGSAPKPHPRYRGRAKILTGELPDPTQAGSGCHFYARCPYGQPICAEQYPSLVAQDETGEHYAACHFSHEIRLQGI